MDKQKEREAFEAWFGNTICDLWCSDNRELQMAWEAWQAAIASAVPEGYCVVPKEPTEEMVKAGQDKLWLEVSAIYKAMIEAAQEQNQ